MGELPFKYVGDLGGDVLEQMAARQAAQQTDEGQQVLVTAIRQGKMGHKLCELQVGSTIADVMARLGWETEGCIYKVVSMTSDATRDVDSPYGYKFTEPGKYTLSVQMLVKGG